MERAGDGDWSFEENKRAVVYPGDVLYRLPDQEPCQELTFEGCLDAWYLLVLSVEL